MIAYREHAMRATISPDARVLDEEVPICRSCTVQKVRWILRGGVPTALSEWFDASDAELEDRTDLYLVFPGCESVGLKVRDAAETPKSKMEVKALRSSPEVVGYSAGVVGRADAWVNRTHPTDEVVDWVRSVVETETTWVEARKRRHLRKYSLDSDQPQEIDIDNRVASGCAVELVTLDVLDGSTWWTFGMESWGEPHDVRSHLRATAQAWFETRGAPTASS